MKRRLIMVAALLSGALVASAAVSAGAAPAGTASAPPITTGAVFNNPKGTTAEKEAIRNHIIQAINKTQRGQLITAALYALKDDEAYAKALVAAHRDRGVNVRLVLDAKYSTFPAAEYVIGELGRDRSQRSWVEVCPAGEACIATGGVNPINHNKFFTFSRVGDAGAGADDVVIQTSANQTLENMKYWNNAYTVVGNKALYTAYNKYFDDLAAMRKNPNYFTSGKVGTEKYYFLPQSTGDVVVDILGNVSCAGRTKVSVAAFALHRDEVASALGSLADQGCDVRIVYANSNDADKLAGHGNIALRQLKTSDGYLVHSKYLLIDGTYANKANTQWTFTGSHNLDQSSLRENDEALLRLEGKAPYDAYQKNFTSLFNQAQP
ncbi:phosphatidylserine/phosphatidylglycerophosphate/cardiolipin synthase family protein [Streptomyces sp. NPDC004609]|uniref:phospholipase D-like domain-containing protein n=1 Tax=Streptomyces sp. NPDC004609 TaxID=3364704 RepID=UPI0036B58599